jgi:hypothetical protein
VVAAEFVDLDHLGEVFRLAGFEQAARQRTSHLYEGGDRVAGPLWIDFGAVTSDDTAFLEASHAFGDGRGGEIHPAAKLLEREPAVGLQGVEDAPVQVIELPFRSKGHGASIPFELMV